MDFRSERTLSHFFLLDNVHGCFLPFGVLRRLYKPVDMIHSVRLTPVIQLFTVLLGDVFGVGIHLRVELVLKVLGLNFLLEFSLLDLELDSGHIHLLKVLLND